MIHVRLKRNGRVEFDMDVFAFRIRDDSGFVVLNPGEGETLLSNQLSTDDIQIEQAED